MQRVSSRAKLLFVSCQLNDLFRPQRLTVSFCYRFLLESAIRGDTGNVDRCLIRVEEWWLFIGRFKLR